LIHRSTSGPGPSPPPAQGPAEPRRAPHERCAATRTNALCAFNQPPSLQEYFQPVTVDLIDHELKQNEKISPAVSHRPHSAGSQQILPISNVIAEPLEFDGNIGHSRPATGARNRPATADHGYAAPAGKRSLCARGRPAGRPADFQPWPANGGPVRGTSAARPARGEPRPGARRTSAGTGEPRPARGEPRPGARRTSPPCRLPPRVLGQFSATGRRDEGRPGPPGPVCDPPDVVTIVRK